MIRRLLLLAAAVAGIVGAAFFPLPLVAQPQSVTVTGTVTVGSITAGTNNIGDVDIVSGTVTTVSTVTTLSQLGGVALPIEDAAETAGGVGIYAMSVRRDVAASSAGTTADNATINTSDLGLVWTRSLDPCDGGEAKSVVSIDIVTATTTEIIDAVASENAHICSINLVTAGANNVALVEDDTDACASPTAGMAGGVTAAEGWNFAANGGLALGNGQGTVLKSAAQNRNVCLITSAAVQLSGTVTYVTK